MAVRRLRYRWWFWITVQAGATDVVTLEGLHLNGVGGIQFISGGHLHVVRCVITNSNFSGNAGISFRAEQRQQAERDRHGDQQ